MLIAYALGHFGFHLFWAVFVFYFAYAADAQYKLRGFKHFHRMKKARPSKHASVEGELSAAWFNFLVSPKRWLLSWFFVLMRKCRWRQCGRT